MITSASQTLFLGVLLHCRVLASQCAGSALPAPGSAAPGGTAENCDTCMAAALVTAGGMRKS